MGMSFSSSSSSSSSCSSPSSSSSSSCTSFSSSFFFGRFKKKSSSSANFPFDSKNYPTAIVLKKVAKVQSNQQHNNHLVRRELYRCLLQLPPQINIMRIYEVVESAESFCVVMEKMEGGELFDFLVHAATYAIPTDVCKYLTKQLLLGLLHLHGSGLLHRDVKPENVMFRYAEKECTSFEQKFEIALIDFDSCKILPRRTHDYKHCIHDCHSSFNNNNCNYTKNNDTHRCSQLMNSSCSSSSLCSSRSTCSSSCACHATNISTAFSSSCSSSSLSPPSPSSSHTYNDTKQLVGTPAYMSPEVLMGSQPSKSSDLWSVGILLFIMLTGSPPVRMQNMTTPRRAWLTLKKYRKTGFGFNSDMFRSPDGGGDLCMKLLEFCVDKRIQNCEEALSHPWLRDDIVSMHMSRCITKKSVSDKSNITMIAESVSSSSIFSESSPSPSTEANQTHQEDNAHAQSLITNQSTLNIVLPFSSFNKKKNNDLETNTFCVNTPPPLPSCPNAIRPLPENNSNEFVIHYRPFTMVDNTNIKIDSNAVNENNEFSLCTSSSGSTGNCSDNNLNVRISPPVSTPEIRINLSSPSYTKKLYSKGENNTCNNNSNCKDGGYLSVPCNKNSTSYKNKNTNTTNKLTVQTLSVVSLPPSSSLSFFSSSSSSSSSPSCISSSPSSTSSSPSSASSSPSSHFSSMNSNASFVHFSASSWSSSSSSSIYACSSPRVQKYEERSTSSPTLLTFSPSVKESCNLRIQKHSTTTNISSRLGVDTLEEGNEKPCSASSSDFNNLNNSIKDCVHYLHSLKGKRTFKNRECYNNRISDCTFKKQPNTKSNLQKNMNNISSNDYTMKEGETSDRKKKENWYDEQRQEEGKRTKEKNNHMLCIDKEKEYVYTNEKHRFNKYEKKCEEFLIGTKFGGAGGEKDAPETSMINVFAEKNKETNFAYADETNIEKNTMACMPSNNNCCCANNINSNTNKKTVNMYNTRNTSSLNNITMEKTDVYYGDKNISNCNSDDRHIHKGIDIPVSNSNTYVPYCNAATTVVSSSDYLLYETYANHVTPKCV